MIAPDYSDVPEPEPAWAAPARGRGVAPLVANLAITPPMPLC